MNMRKALKIRGISQILLPLWFKVIIWQSNAGKLILIFLKSSRIIYPLMSVLCICVCIHKNMSVFA